MDQRSDIRNVKEEKETFSTTEIQAMITHIMTKHTNRQREQTMKDVNKKLEETKELSKESVQKKNTTAVQNQKRNLPTR